MSALKDIAEGKPLRTPIHPALVHLPVALLPLSLLLDIGSWIFPDQPYLVRSAFFALVSGIVTGLIAAVFGLVDYSEIRVDHRAKKTARLHMILNVVAIGLFAVGAFLRYPELDATRTALVPLFFSVVAVGLVGYSGYLGGHLVYSDGIGVGRHRRDAPHPKETIAPSSEDRLVALMPARELAEGDSRRVEVAGVILVVAKVMGKVYAFQEFCTHRYGPLSEGAFKGHEVICPWHCSQFDVRTGRVTQGPAKVPLRTFRVEIKDGRICVERPTPAKAPESR
jgi:nitrite reductase/ring-hydroxylating ferredoxin subunit/uncharacterized membrane protein